MGCWICDQAVRHGGFEFTFGDEYKALSPAEMAELMKELTGEEPAKKKDRGPSLSPPANLVPEEPGEKNWSVADLSNY